MALVDIDFEWPVAEAGYAICDYGAGAPGATILTGGRSGAWLKPKGSGLEWRRPIADHPQLFMYFAHLSDRTEDCQNFASQFGLLLSAAPDAEEAFDTWLHHIHRFRRLVEIWQGGNSAGLLWQTERGDLRGATIVGSLVWRDGRPRLALKPNSLLSGLRLQFFQAVSELREIKACDQCRRWFEHGAGTGRRRGARFCSDKCRIDFHNARKGAGK